MSTQKNPSGPTVAQKAKAIASGPLKPIFVNVAFFAAGLAFLNSPLADYLAPDI